MCTDAYVSNVPYSMSRTQQLCALYAVPTSKQSSECLYDDQTTSINQQLMFAAWSKCVQVSAVSIQQPYDRSIATKLQVHSLGMLGKVQWYRVPDKL